jgi:hypothetical protein
MIGHTVSGDRQPGQANPTSDRFPPAPDWRALLAIMVGGCVYTLLLLDAPFLGHDYYWLVESTHGLYSPWTYVVLTPFRFFDSFVGSKILQGFTLSSVAVITYSYGRATFENRRGYAIAGVLFALLSPLPWMVLWAGQIDVLILVGVFTQPYGIPLLFAKPTFGIFSVVDNRRDLLVACGFLLVSLIIWGLWPLDTLRVAVSYSAGHLIAMGWLDTIPWVVIPGLVLLLLSNRDPLRLMATGAFLFPYVAPYHFIILLPALGRVKGFAQFFLWLLFFLPFISGGITTLPVKLMTLLLPLGIWLLLAPSLRPREVLADPDTILSRSLRTLRAIWGEVRRLSSAKE